MRIDRGVPRAGLVCSGLALGDSATDLVQGAEALLPEASFEFFPLLLLAEAELSPAGNNLSAAGVSPARKSWGDAAELPAGGEPLVSGRSAPHVHNPARPTHPHLENAIAGRNTG